MHVVEDEVYEVRDQGERGGELPASRHSKADDESDCNGYGSPGDGLGEGASFRDQSKLFGNQLGNFVGI